MQGKVIKFNNKLGYGFIKSEECDKDIFVHFSAILQSGYRSLDRGDTVEFDFDKDTIKALNVKRIKKGSKYIRGYGQNKEYL